MSQLIRSTLALSLIMSLLGCGEPSDDPDAGPLADASLPGDAGDSPADAGPADAGPSDGSPSDAGPTACTGARVITLTDGRATVTGSTAGRSAPLTLGCGIEPSPQEILELTVPGTGTVGVSLYLSGGSGIGDPLVEVRRSCDGAADALCLTDDSRLADHASGAFLAEGGETLLLVVSGDRASNTGDWRLDIATATGIEARCGTATPVTLTPGVASSVTVTPHTTIGDTGSIYSSCSPSHLEEALLDVTMPATGSYDLVATTARPANSTFLDTYLYAHGECGDPRTEVGCADDVSDSDFRSLLVTEGLTPGATYTIGVELGGGMDDVEVQLWLVRVLDAGASCDPDDGWTRCRDGACSAATGLCPAP